MVCGSLVHYYYIKHSFIFCVREHRGPKRQINTEKKAKKKHHCEQRNKKKANKLYREEMVIKISSILSGFYLHTQEQSRTLLTTNIISHSHINQFIKHIHTNTDTDKTHDGVIG